MAEWQEAIALKLVNRSQDWSWEVPYAANFVQYMATADPDKLMSYFQHETLTIVITFII